MKYDLIKLLIKGLGKAYNSLTLFFMHRQFHGTLLYHMLVFLTKNSILNSIRVVMMCRNKLSVLIMKLQIRSRLGVFIKHIAFVRHQLGHR